MAEKPKDQGQGQGPKQSPEHAAQQAAAQQHGQGAIGHTGAAQAPGTANPEEQSAIRAPFTPAPQVGAQTTIAEAGGEWTPPSQGELDQQAEEREKQRARSRGVPEDELADLAENTIWVVSNRIDDRVVPGSWERDPRHPGGEMILGGPTPQRVYRTTTVERLIMGGELIEVDAPLATVEINDHEGKKMTVRNRKMPVEIMVEPGLTWAAQPGHPTPIGRQLDKELFHPNTLKKVAARQRQLPAEIQVPQGGFVPRHQDVDRPA